MKSFSMDEPDPGVPRVQSELWLEERLRRDAGGFPPRPSAEAVARMRPRLEARPRARASSRAARAWLALAASLALALGLWRSLPGVRPELAPDGGWRIAAAMPGVAKRVRSALRQGGRWTLGTLDDELELLFGRELMALRSDADRAAGSVLHGAAQPWILLRGNRD